MTPEELVRHEAERMPVRSGDLQAVVQRARRRRSAHRLVVVGGAVSVVLAAAMAVPILLADPGTSGTADTAVPATTPPTTETSTVTTVATSEARPAGAVCGGELPFQVAVPDDFTGPVQGPSPGAPEPEPGQHVRHWIGRGGSVELRFPADGSLDPGFWEEDGDRQPIERHDDGVSYVVMEEVVVDGVDLGILPQAYASFPFHSASDPCDVVQVQTFGGSGGASFTNGEEAGSQVLGILPDIPRPEDRRLIAGVSEDEVPSVHACVESPTPVIESEEPPPLEPAPTAPEALLALLDTSVAETWPRYGYVRYDHPDGSVVFGKPLQADPFQAPASDEPLVVSVRVAPVDSGWVVESWSTSGC